MMNVGYTCTCMATRHQFYTSCIQCGNIFCVEYTPKVCSFCGFDLQLPLTAEIAQNIYSDTSLQNAYKLKDKLLRFDKENAKRTQVYDTQTDYYENSNWLSEEEKLLLIDKEKERQNLVTSINRPTSMLSLNLENGDIRISNIEPNVTKDSTSSTCHTNFTPNCETVSCSLLPEKSQDSKGQFRLANDSMSKNKGKIGEIYSELHLSNSNNLIKSAKVLQNSKRGKSSHVQYEDESNYSNNLFDFE